MPARWPLGNDIVDLRLVANRRSAGNPRYLKRVLATDELIAVGSTADSHRIFWMYWAAKEAVYKTLRKIDPELALAHRRFLVRLTDRQTFGSSHGRAEGVVTHGGDRVPVIWAWSDHWVHCVAGGGYGRQSSGVRNLSDFSADSASAARAKSASLPDASVAVRLLAKSLLARAGIDELELEIVRYESGRRPGPPQVTQRGDVLAGVDVSLSHDGDYVAAAVGIQP